MRRHDTNVGALLTGLLFVAIGIYGISVTPTRLADSLRWLWPIMLIGLGVALLVRPSRSRSPESASPESGSPMSGTPTSESPLSGSEHRTSDEIGAEGSEDGEIEEPGGSHDSGVSPLL